MKASSTYFQKFDTSHGFYILPRKREAAALNKKVILFNTMIGCTSDMFQCYQVRVQYIDQDYKNNTAIDEFHESTWKNLSRYDNLENEVYRFSDLIPSLKCFKTIIE